MKATTIKPKTNNHPQSQKPQQSLSRPLTEIPPHPSKDTQNAKQDALNAEKNIQGFWAKLENYLETAMSWGLSLLPVIFIIILFMIAIYFLWLKRKCDCPSQDDYPQPKF